jgi:hypothetical protein
LGPKCRNRAFVDWFWVCHVKWRCGGMLGGGGCRLMLWRQQGARAFANMRLGSGVWAKNLKPSICGSISGVPCETAVWGDVVRWWVQVAAMVTAGGPRVRQHEAGEWVLGQKPETKYSWLDFGRAV